MSDFSREYDSINGDFSIVDEFDRLEPNQSVNLICEGYGFKALAKNLKGEPIVGFKNFVTDKWKWIPFHKLNKNTKNIIWK